MLFTAAAISSSGNFKLAVSERRAGNADCHNQAGHFLVLGVPFSVKADADKQTSGQGAGAEHCVHRHRDSELKSFIVEYGGSKKYCGHDAISRERNHAFLQSPPFPVHISHKRLSSNIYKLSKCKKSATARITDS